MTDKIEIETLHLFPILDKMLIELLQSLTDEEWQAQTVAKLWKVKDVASHLLDGNLRALSNSRDGYFAETPEKIDTYQDLIDYLNHLNMSWTNATKRLSPQVLITLLDASGKEYYNHLQSLDPYDPAIFSVAWAGQKTSPNWFHIAREYTEKFLHQQQIRDAVDKPGIMTKELFHPFIDIFMYAFPYTFRNTPAREGTIVAIEVTTDIGGQWNIIRSNNHWELVKNKEVHPHAKVTIDPITAWKLFSKSWTPDQISDKVTYTGDRTLGYQALSIVAVMA